MAIEAVIGSLGSAPVTGVNPGTPGPGAAAAGEGFSSSFGKLLDAVNVSEAGANTAVGKMLDGSGDVHEAMIALQQADLMLSFTVQVRNKLVQAYQDIMRMPV